MDGGFLEAAGDERHGAPASHEVLEAGFVGRRRAADDFRQGPEKRRRVQRRRKAERHRAQLGAREQDAPPLTKNSMRVHAEHLFVRALALAARGPFAASTRDI